MPVGELVALVFAASGCLVAWRYWNERTWLLSGIIILALGAADLVVFGLQLVAIPDPVIATTVLVMTVVGLLLWAQVLGLPRWLALLLGIGLTSRPLRFSNRLSELRQPIKGLTVARADPVRMARGIKTVESHLRRLRGLHAPDEAWAAVRDDLADCDSRWVDLVRTDAPAEQFAEHVEAYGPVMARWTELRDRAASAQRQLATPARRRRGAILSYGSLASSLILLGVVQVFALNSPVSGLGDRHFWAAVLPFVGAIVLFGVLASDLRRRVPG